MILILGPIIQAVYIVYMLNYFKTKYSLSHPATYFENKLLYHPIGVSDKPVSNVCKLGHILSWYLGGFVILRSIFIENKICKNLFRNVSIIVLIFSVILSMLNFNVVVYLLPHYIIEYYLINNNYYY
jgi:hypothetical protein